MVAKKMRRTVALLLALLTACEAVVSGVVARMAVRVAAATFVVKIAGPDIRAVYHDRKQRVWVAPEKGRRAVRNQPSDADPEKSIFSKLREAVVSGVMESDAPWE